MGEKTHVSLRLLLPTSNDCGRLLSKAGNVLNIRRKHITPTNLESQLFLNLNKDLWPAKDI